MNIGDGNERADANGSSGVADGQWHTLSCSFDRDGMMRLYTDGVFSAEEDISAVGDIDVGSGWFFGSDILGAYSYTGRHSEVRFWHGVLSEEAISAWHCSSLTTPTRTGPPCKGIGPSPKAQAWKSATAAGSGLIGTVQGAEWNQPEGVITFDYSNTPRIVDVAVTAWTTCALTLEPDWNLDRHLLGRRMQHHRCLAFGPQHHQDHALSQSRNG